MNKNVSEKLELWASNNNWALSQSLDQERFWDFVVEAFKSGDHEITEADFYIKLIPHCSDEDILTESYIKYQNGIELLKRSTK